MERQEVPQPLTDRVIFVASGLYGTPQNPQQWISLTGKLLSFTSSFLVPSSTCSMPVLAIRLYSAWADGSLRGTLHDFMNDPIFYVAIFISLISISLTYRATVYPYLLSPLKHIPGPSLLDGHLLLGHYPQILASEAGQIQKYWVEKYGSTVKAVGPFGLERLIFTSPKALRAILVEKASYFDKPKFVQNILALTTGATGILAATGAEHRSLRQAFSPAVSAHKILRYQNSLREQVAATVDSLVSQIGHATHHSAVILMHPYASRLALRIAASVAFGFDVDDTPDTWATMASAYNDVLAYQSGANITKFAVLLSIPGAARLLLSRRCYRFVKSTENWARRWFPFIAPIYVTVSSMHTIRTMARTIIEDNLHTDQDGEYHLSDRSEKHVNTMQILLRQHLSLGPAQASAEWTAEGREDAIDVMVDQFIAFLGAGHETVSSALTWMLWLLASHPYAQDELRKELCTNGGQGGPTHDSLQSLPYLSAVIYESLRLFPPIPASFREAVVDTDVDGTFVPKGTMIYLGIRTINTLESYWGPDAAEFRPSRWLDHFGDGSTPKFDLTKPTGKDNSFAFQSFLSGSHACLGRAMAMIEIKMMLSSLIGSLAFSPAYDRQVASPSTGVTMTPSDHLPLRVTLAKHSSCCSEI